MMDSQDISVLAIDGGGTRCRFALVRGDDRLVVETGSANVSTDFDGTVQCLRGGIQALAERAGIAPETLHALTAFVGLAGVTGDTLSSQLAAALPLRNAQYADDRRAALRGALGGDDGLVAHCGTGSFFAAHLSGQERLAGGWGSVLGDEASAQWVGRKALSQLLCQIDGWVPKSALIEDLQTQLSSAADVVEFARNADPAAFGSIAPSVTAHAAQGDPVALGIMQSAADYTSAGLEKMGWAPGLPICLTGGIGPHYAPFLPVAMKDALAAPLGEPLDGAVALALGRNREIANGHR